MLLHQLLLYQLLPLQPGSSLQPGSRLQLSNRGGHLLLMHNHLLLEGN